MNTEESLTHAAADLALVKRVLSDVICAAHRIDGIEYAGQPVYQIEHVTLNGVLQQYRTEVTR